jgi:DNA-directed RNA polymerase specialized sigma24 family protein
VDAHKRRAYKFAMMESLQGMREANEGWLPPSLEGVDPAPLADEQAEASIMQRVVQFCIGRLQNPNHQAVIRRMLAGETTTEICRQMHRSDKWVKQQADAAKTELKHYLELEGITSWP